MPNSQSVGQWNAFSPNILGGYNSPDNPYQDPFNVNISSQAQADNASQYVDPYGAPPTPYGSSGGGGGTQSALSAGQTSALGGGIAAGAIGALAGGIEAGVALHGLNQLNKQPLPNYSVSPELQSAYATAQANQNQGLSQGEKAGFQSQINRGAATNLYNAQKMGGGNLSVALEGAIGSQKLGAYDQLASIDADVRRQNLQNYYGLSNQMQQQKNLISQQNISYRMYQEQVYGQALSAGLSNLTKGVQGAAAGAAGLLI